VSIRHSLSRVLLIGALLGGGALAVVGALALGGAGLIVAGLVALLAGCVAAGIARETRKATGGAVVEAAVWGAGLAGGAVLVVAGLTTVAGGVAAAIAVAVGLNVGFILRVRRLRAAARTRSATDRRGVAGAPALLWPAALEQAPVLAADAHRLLLPVAELTTQALGDEWLHTTAALAGRLDPATRQSLVARREEALDELERRDPQGFAQWLMAGSTRGSDPADFVRGGPARRGPVADTDAA
jgi:hypothetical protein